MQKAQQNYNQTLESKKNLDVVSDIGGIITKIYVSAGDSVSNGAKIADVTDNSTMVLEVPFNTNDADHLYVGERATVTLDGSFETLTGTVASINGVKSVLDGNMIVRYVKINVKNPGALKTSDYATAVVGSYACNGSAVFAPHSAKDDHDEDLRGCKRNLL